jgi:predicted nucleotidyltransferase
MKNDILHTLRTTEIREIFTRNNVQRVYLVGSFARGEETSDSDIDLVFEKPHGVIFSLFNIGDIKSSLEIKLGREVDLVSSSAIHPKFRTNLERDKILVI